MENDNEKCKKEEFKKEFIKKLIDFSIRVIRLCEVLRKQKIFYSLLDQVIRSSCSIGANVVEARAASSKKDYIKYFQIALKSTNETLYWLIILKEIAIYQREEINRLYDGAQEIARIIATSLLTLKGKKSF